MASSEALRYSPTPKGPEGPFYLPKQPLRSNIVEDREGLPFLMKFNIKNCNGGKPIANAEVHAWHADANGIYSSYLGLYPLGKKCYHYYLRGSFKNSWKIKLTYFFSEKHEIRGEGHVEPTDDSTFLRGIQPTDANGSAVFQTVFPGWYGSRTPHIHFKVFVGGKNCYTGEVYFEDSLTDEIIAKGVKPYCERDASNKKTNNIDPLFGKHSGFKTVVVPEGDVAVSLRASLDVLVCV